MHPQRTVEKTGAGTTGAVLLQRFEPCFHDRGLGGQTKVVVGAQHDAAFPFHDDFRVLPCFQRVKIGIDPFCAELVGKREAFALFKNVHMYLPLILCE